MVSPWPEDKPQEGRLRKKEKRKNEEEEMKRVGARCDSVSQSAPRVIAARVMAQNHRPPQLPDKCRDGARLAAKHHDHW